MLNKHLEAYMREKGWFPYTEHPKYGNVEFENEWCVCVGDWFHPRDLNNPCDVSYILRHALEADKINL